MVLSELDSRRSLRSEPKQPDDDKGKGIKSTPPPRKVRFTPTELSVRVHHPGHPIQQIIEAGILV